MVNAVFASFFFSIYFFIEIYVVVFLRNVTQDARDVHRRQVNVRLRRGFDGSLVRSASLGLALQFSLPNTWNV